MTKQVINIGQTANDRSGDPLRLAFDKINQNFNELYTLTGGSAADLKELAQDYAAEMFTGGTHSGITVTYNDSTNKINLTVPPIPTDVSDLTDTTNLLGGTGLGTGDVRFSGTVMSADYDSSLYIATATTTDDHNTITLGQQTIELVVDNYDSHNSAKVKLNNSTAQPVAQIVVGNASSPKTWTFDSDGILTLPGTGTIRTAYGAMSINAPTGSSNLSIKSNDATTYMIVGNGSAGVTVGSYNWEFSNSGNLTVPGNINSTKDSIAIGMDAGSAEVGSVSIGYNAGHTSQGNYGVAIGASAGKTSQTSNAVAIGNAAGYDTQGGLAIAIGSSAGQTNQSTNSIAIGTQAGYTGQGELSIAIGNGAGYSNQPDRTIILNATGSNISGDADQTDRFYVKPVRQVSGGTVPSGFYPTYYNPTTGEFIVVTP